MKFDKQTAKATRDLITKELEALGKRIGVEFSVGACSYSDIEMSYKLVVKTGDKAAVVAEHKKTFETYAKLYGFEPEDFGKEFTHSRETWTIEGFELKRAKFNLRGKRVSDGKVALFVSDQIAKQFHPVTVA